LDHSSVTAPSDVYEIMEGEGGEHLSVQILNLYKSSISTMNWTFGIIPQRRNDFAAARFVIMFSASIQFLHRKVRQFYI
jgi:hypothetical protein